jgi:hypothetical protein
MSDTSISTWEPVDADEAASLIGEGVHTGLRKGSDAEGAHDLWLAIDKLSTSAWSDALEYMVSGLEYMGYQLCTRVDAEADVVLADADNTGG